MKRKIILFFILTISITFFTYFIHYANMDEIWNYGFSYNIAKGAIPYKDFNMVVLPLYSLIMAIPLKLIANNLFVYHLFNAMLASFILVILDDKSNIKSVLLLLCILCIDCIFGYNYFIMLLLLLVTYLENSNYKYKNEIIGLILGSILATKQNIGVLLFIPYFFHSKRKLKSTLCYILPITFVMIYLFVNNALIECIDYCFFGIKNFTSNLYIQSWKLVIIELIIIAYIIISYIKTKDINYIYLLLFKSIDYPLFEFYHFIIGVIPLIYYFSLKENNLYIYLVLIILMIFMITTRIFSYGISKSNLNNFKYRNMGIDTDKWITNIIKFNQNNDDKRIFIFDDYSYIVKISSNKEIDKFDLINRGNMGSNEYKYIDDLEKICHKKKCLFIMNPNSFKNNQLNEILKDYVLDNYEYCGSTPINYYCKKEEG